MMNKLTCDKDYYCSSTYKITHICKNIKNVYAVLMNEKVFEKRMETYTYSLLHTQPKHKYA